jgi:CRISP-associated protein Cas1
MGTLYIDRKDIHVRLDGNALAFYSRGKREGVVPLTPLKRAVVVGNITLETPVLHRLADENVTVVFLSGKRLRFRGMLHGRLHNNGLLRVKQYEKSLSGFSLDMARDLVKRKIIKQAGVLGEVKEARPELGHKLAAAIQTLLGVIEAVESQAPGVETLRGLEGGAGASYFSALVTLFPPSLKFERRTRRPPNDPVNAMLSLCYTMLHFEMLREIEVAGLDPTIGFYHSFEYGRESLACDLVEPYRPDVDRFVYEAFRTRQFTGRDFTEDDERPGCYLRKGSRRKFYPLYEEWAKEMRPLWADEARAIARRILDGQDAVSE